MDEKRALHLAVAALVTIIALVLGVGLVSSGVLRHLVQTAPSWLTVYFGIRYRTVTKWAALPAAFFWLALMVLIWFYLLGWARIVTGHFRAIEIAMTIVVGVASAFAIVQALRIHSDLKWWSGVIITGGVLVLQLIAFRISLLPGIANH